MIPLIRGTHLAPCSLPNTHKERLLPLI